MRRRIRFQPARDLEAVDPGHHHVEQNDIALRACANIERLLALGCEQLFEMLRAQANLQEFQIGLIVVDDENAGTHDAVNPVSQNAATLRETSRPKSASRDNVQSP